MKLLLRLLLSLGFVGFALSTQAAPEQGIRLELTPPEAPVRAGYVRMTADLHHEGREAVRLVLPGDGSAVGWRTPHVTWKVKRIDGKPVVAAPLGGRCGNINGFKASEIFTLKPGGKKDLGVWIGGPSLAAGEYEIRLLYHNDPTLKMRGLVMRRPGAADPYDEVKTTTAIKIVSAPVRVTVLPPE